MSCITRGAPTKNTSEQVLEDLSDEELMAYIAKRKAAKATVPAVDTTDEGDVDETELDDEPNGDIEEVETSNA